MATKDITDKQVCEAYFAMRKLKESGIHKWPYEILERYTGQPGKVCLRAMERAHRKGLIEYGVSLRSGWLTEKGQGILDAHSLSQS